jgi:hypothetical protein
MHPSSQPLLTRLRRHRGLWVLVLAVMLIKLVSGALCATDGPQARFAATAAASTSVVAMVDSPLGVADTGACVLGEAGDCHCTCAHSVTLPAAALPAIAGMDIRFAVLMIQSGFTPATTGSLLRPPIA